MNESMAKASSEERKKYASNKNYQITTFVMNVQDNKSVQDIVDYVVKEFGRLDYAVNPAGVAAMRKQTPKRPSGTARATLAAESSSTSTLHPPIRLYVSCPIRLRSCAAREPWRGAHIVSRHVIMSDDILGDKHAVSHAYGQIYPTSLSV
ncbi:hypothetical protein F4801DRAFT_573479 [Xylaria longipes]|nr:hypothetical protein F4801DRAFT_573479 [Xylaria longipes]